MSKKKILVTGGDGRFAKVLSKYNRKLNLYFASKKECNILNINSLNKIISSNLITKESHVHIMHKLKSVIRAIACFEYRGSDKMIFVNSFIKLLFKSVY